MKCKPDTRLKTDHRGWRETREILQDSQLMKEIAEAKEDIKAGRLAPHADVIKSLKRKNARPK